MAFPRDEVKALYQQALKEGEAQAFYRRAGKRTAQLAVVVGHGRRRGMREQIPTIGRIVHFLVSAQDALAINARRTPWTQGNEVSEGMLFPMVIVAVWGQEPGPTSLVNGQVFLDGTEVFWATSRTVGTEPGTYRWPEVR